VVSRSLTIAGISRWSDYLRNTLRIQRGLTYTANSCKFEVDGDKPSPGDEVIICDTAFSNSTNPAGRVFAGLIVNVEMVETLDHRPLWAVDCDDYSALLDRRLVTEVYTSKTVQEIAEDIASKYIDSGFTVSVQPNTLLVEKFVFQYAPVSDALKRLVDYVGWSWYCDEYKNISIFDPQTLLSAAPMSLSSGGFFRNLKLKTDITSLRNRVIIQGGVMLSDTQTLEFVADGYSRAWVLPYIFQEISALTVAGAAKTIGVEGDDDEALYQFLFSRKEPRLRCSAGTTTPTASAVMHVEGKFYLPVLTQVDDYDSQEVMGHILGNDGVFEYSLEDASLITLEAAEAAGQADLREHANPNQSGSFDTDVTGWIPGQIVNIDLPYRGACGDYLVQATDMQPFPLSGWKTTVQFGGRLLGMADFLTLLVSNQRGAETVDTATVQKFVYGIESAMAADDWDFTSRSSPYFLEAAGVGGLGV